MCIKQTFTLLIINVGKEWWDAQSKIWKSQRDGIYRESILEHFLPISKQTPKPLAYKECKDVVVCFFKKKIMSNEMG